MDIKDLQSVINKTVKELEKLEELKMKIAQTVTFNSKWSDEVEKEFHEPDLEIIIDKKALEKIVIGVFLAYNEIDIDKDVRELKIVWR